MQLRSCSVPYHWRQKQNACCPAIRALSCKAGACTGTARYYQFILMYTHISTSVQQWGSPDQQLTRQTFHKRPMIFSTSKIRNKKEIKQWYSYLLFLNIHAVWSTLMTRGTPKPVPKLSTYNHQWAKFNTGALLFMYSMLMQCVCLLSVHYGILH